MTVWSQIKKYFKRGNPHLVGDFSVKDNYKLYYGGEQVFNVYRGYGATDIWLVGPYENIHCTQIEDLDLTKLEVYKKL